MIESPGQICRCACGHVSFEVNTAPVFRMLCHCSICQRFNSADFADVSVYLAKEVVLPASETVEYRTFKPPPNVQRGVCVNCDQPAIETFNAPLFPSLVMVPRAMHTQGEALPEPCGHVFYETRVADVSDALPKHTGFVASQLVFFNHLLKHVFKAKLFGSRRV